MPPHQAFHDGEEIIFNSQVAAVLFGPSCPQTAMNPQSKQLIDVTPGVQQLILQGRSHFLGGLQTPLKFHPAPGMPTIAFVYYLNSPDISCGDFDTVKFESGRHIVKAYYAKEGDAVIGNVGDYADVTEGARKVMQSGRMTVEGGIFQTAVGDPFPNVKKRFMVFYY